VERFSSRDCTAAGEHDPARVAPRVPWSGVHANLVRGACCRSCPAGYPGRVAAACSVTRCRWRPCALEDVADGDPSSSASILRRSETRLVVPTLPAFVAMKLTAWLDRRAARDLFDLAALARLGAVTDEVFELVETALGYRPSAAMLRLEPQGNWNIELSNQISDPGTANGRQRSPGGMNRRRRTDTGRCGAPTTTSPKVASHPRRAVLKTRSPATSASPDCINRQSAYSAGASPTGQDPQTSSPGSLRLTPVPPRPQ